MSKKQNEKLSFGARSFLRCQECGTSKEVYLNGKNELLFPGRWGFHDLPYGGSINRVMLCSVKCLNSYQVELDRRKVYQEILEFGEEFAKAVEGRKVVKAEFTCLDYGPHLRLTFESGHRARIMLWNRFASAIDDGIPQGKDSLGLMPEWGSESWRQKRTEDNFGRSFGG